MEVETSFSAQINRLPRASAITSVYVKYTRAVVYAL